MNLHPGHSSTDQSLVAKPPDFNRLARVYRWMEWASFGPLLSWCRCTFLSQLTGCRRALVLGDGDGRFTARLLASNSTVRIDVVDASSAMLQALRHRAGRHAARVRTQLADARVWQATKSSDSSSCYPSYDLIATHFFLDCLTTDEISSLAATIAESTSPSAKWVISEFAIPNGWFGEMVARPLVWGLYLAFGCLTGLKIRRLPDHAAALHKAGFTIQDRFTWLRGLLISELWSADTCTPKRLA